MLFSLFVTDLISYGSYGAVLMYKQSDFTINLPKQGVAITLTLGATLLTTNR